MVRKVLYALLVTTLVLVPILGIFPEQAAQASKSKSTAKWTFMVYLDADNNLQPYADLNIAQMEKIGSTPNVNIIVLYDRANGKDGLYQVESGKLAPLSNSPFGAELNTGDPSTAQKFLDYVFKYFSADHYFLDIWDHGNDFVGTCTDLNTGLPTVPTSYLYHYQLVPVLKSAVKQIGRKIDILAFDGCLQGVAEVAYDYKDVANYLIGSEGYVLLNGYPYDQILSTLTSNPVVSPADFATTVVDQYVNSYTGKTGADFATLSSIDLSQMNTFVVDFNSLLTTLENNIGSYKGALSAGRGQAHLPWSEYGWDAIVDLGTLVERIGIGSSNRTLLDIDSAVYVRSSPQMTNMSVHGLGIFFPPSKAAMINDTGLDGQFYETLVPFATETEWLDFLTAYYSAP